MGEYPDVQAILFDFGGTLDSDGEHWLDRFYDLYGRAGLDFPSSEIKRAFYEADALCYGDRGVVSKGLRPLMRHHVHLQFTALNLRDEEKERFMAERFCSESERFLDRNALLLGNFKRKYRLGVVSNFYGNLESLCREAGLLESLEVLLDSARVVMSKPDLGIFQVALTRLKLSPGEVIFVGDSYERDMMPSRELGMKTIWLKGPHPRIPEGARPVDAIISHLPELGPLIL
jgi:HAD superfamily hydrolase (TIGR01509 family)